MMRRPLRRRWTELALFRHKRLSLFPSDASLKTERYLRQPRLMNAACARESPLIGVVRSLDRSCGAPGSRSISRLAATTQCRRRVCDVRARPRGFPTSDRSRLPQMQTRAHSLRALINRRAIPRSGIKQPPLLAAISHAIRNGRPSKARDDGESVEPRESILVARLGTLRFATSIARPFH